MSLSRREILRVKIYDRSLFYAIYTYVHAEKGNFHFAETKPFAA